MSGQTEGSSPERRWGKEEFILLGAMLLVMALACVVLIVFIASPIISRLAPKSTLTPTPTSAPVGEVTKVAVPTETPLPPVVTLEPTPASVELHIASTDVAPETQPTSAPTSTPLPPPPPLKPLRMASPEYGMQAFQWWRPETADRDLQLIRDAGFTWVKQGFGWRDIEGEAKGVFEWSRTDRIVYTCNRYGLDLLVRLDHQPAWTGGGFPANGPPDNYADFGDFVYALASRYRGRIRAYQIWNEPNLSREWGDRSPNAAEYVALLKVANQRIKEADPNAMVITAGLTPTGTQPPIAIPDDEYLRQMYQAGLKGNFDVLGAHGAGYKAPPELSPDEAAADPAYGGERFFCFRRVEDLRRIMEENGDADTQIAILEFGWTSDPVHPEYSWHAVSEEQKADYLVRAYKWAGEHWSPWIGVMSLIYICDADWTEDNEQYWWAITTPAGDPRMAYMALKGMAK